MLKVVRFKIFLCISVTCLGSCATVPARDYPPLEVVSKVNINKYLGKWYEIARYPNWFQENCYTAIANYELTENGSIKVVNRCRQGGFDGKTIEAVGVASSVDERSNAKLKVSFYWPFYSNYWIIALGDNYEYAVVSEPKRQCLWILSRTPVMEKWFYDKLVKYLEEKHFDISLLIYTSQSKYYK